MKYAIIAILPCIYRMYPNICDLVGLADEQVSLFVVSIGLASKEF